jgi:hypothetical protein
VFGLFESAFAEFFDRCMRSARPSRRPRRLRASHHRASRRRHRASRASRRRIESDDDARLYTHFTRLYRPHAPRPLAYIDARTAMMKEKRKTHGLFASTTQPTTQLHCFLIFLSECGLSRTSTFTLRLVHSFSPPHLIHRRPRTAGTCGSVR